MRIVKVTQWRESGLEKDGFNTGEKKVKRKETAKKWKPPLLSSPCLPIPTFTAVDAVEDVDTVHAVDAVQHQLSKLVEEKLRK